MEKTVPSTTASVMMTMKTENLQDNTSSSISTLVNGTILKTALTNPSEVKTSFAAHNFLFFFFQLHEMLFFVVTCVGSDM